MRKFPGALYKGGNQIVVGITPFVTGRAVADLKIPNVFRGFIEKIVAVTRTCFEPRTHPGQELGAAFIRVQRWLSRKDVDKLILSGVRVAKG